MGIVSALIALSKSKSKTKAGKIKSNPIKEVKFLVRYYNKCCGFDSSLIFQVDHNEQDIMKSARNHIIKNLPNTCQGFFSVEGIYLVYE